MPKLLLWARVVLGVVALACGAFVLVDDPHTSEGPVLVVGVVAFSAALVLQALWSRWKLSSRTSR